VRGRGAYPAAAESEEDAERREDDGEEDLEERAAAVFRHRDLRADRIGIGVNGGGAWSPGRRRSLPRPSLCGFTLPVRLGHGGGSAGGVSCAARKSPVRRHVSVAMPPAVRVRGCGHGPPQVGSGPSRTAIVEWTQPAVFSFRPS
jgi:hypothetical protein